MTSDWDPALAAERLLDSVGHDPRPLRLLRARVSRAMLHRPTILLARACETLDVACAA